MTEAIFEEVNRDFCVDEKTTLNSHALPPPQSQFHSDSVSGHSQSPSQTSHSEPQTSRPSSIATDLELGLDVTSIDGLKEDERSRLLTQAKLLVKRLERPEDVIWRIIWEGGSQRGCIRVAIDLGIFDILSRKSPESLTADELGAITGAQSEFLVRILRVLTSIDFVEEVGLHRYAASSLTIVMADPGLASGFKICNDHGAAIQNNMSYYFREKGYSSPECAIGGPFQWHFRTDQEYFDKIYGSPESTRDFDTFMASQRLQVVHWSSWFPIESEIFQPVTARITSPGNQDVVSIVDIGGGSGHDLAHLLRAFPEAPGRFVVQDLPEIIGKRSFDSQISGESAKSAEKMVHDMFQPQPIIGARAYYLRIVLHDWPDSACRKVLTNIAKAMVPQWSRILLNELVVPEIGCPAHTAAADINMMCNFAGRERTEREWRLLAASCGLYVVKIWVSDTSKTSLIELQLSDDGR